MSRLIDADALTERLNEYANDDWNVSLGGVFTDAVDTCLDFVENAPTIEAVPVVYGEWEVNGVNPHNMTIGNWRCTACDGISLKDSNFCPNCGANMKGGDK